MSHTSSLIAAPPPPPLSKNQWSSNANEKAEHITHLQIRECLWSINLPELQKACYLNRVCQFEKPQSCQYNDVVSILQKGPTCGLTALSMMLREYATSATPDYLLHLAKQSAYTNNGEMFSASYLYELCSKQLEIVQIPEMRCELHEGVLNCDRIKEALLASACLLVPYDPDSNHAPCLKYGHKAHWALIVGYLITTQDEFYVVARHGKSRNLAVWSLEALSTSNANLLEFAQPKGYLSFDFLLPPGGISGELGLRERAIIVKGLPHRVMQIS